MRPVQYFSREYLERCKKMSPEEIGEFLEGFRLLQESRKGSRLISLKVPEDLLGAFRRKCNLTGVRYQTQIKLLMARWLDVPDRRPQNVVLAPLAMPTPPPPARAGGRSGSRPWRRRTRRR